MIQFDVVVAVDEVSTAAIHFDLVLMIVSVDIMVLLAQ